MRRWEGSCVPARDGILSPALDGLQGRGRGDVAGGRMGRWDHPPRGRAGRDPGLYIPGGAVALQLIRDDHPGSVVAPVPQLTDALRRGLLVAPRRDEDIPPLPVLIHRAPEGVPRAIDREEDLLQGPCVARAGTPAPELMGNILAKRQTPWANGVRRDDASPGEPQLFDSAIAAAEAALPPHRRADALGWEAVSLVTVGRWCMHTTSMAH